MDALDMRILRIMGTGPYEHGARHPRELTATALAKRVASTRQTVQARIARMERAQLIQGYEIFPNLHHLGLGWGIYHWRLTTPEAKTQLFQRVKPVDGINGVFQFVTNDVCVDLYWTNPQERDRRLQLLATLAGDVPPLTLFSRSTPPVRRPLTSLDWRIIRALRGRAKTPLSTLAKELGVSSRTVKRRYEQMAKDGSFDIYPIVALENLPNTIAVSLLFHLAPGAGQKTTQALLREFDRECLSVWVPPSPELGDFDMTVYVQGTAGYADVRRRALAVPGVARLETLLYEDARINPDWLNEAIDRKLEQSAVSTGASRPRANGHDRRPRVQPRAKRRR